MKRLFIAATAALALASLAGCASTGSGFSKGETSAAAQLVVKYAAMKYIEQASPIERAQRAKRVIDVARLVAESARGEPITLQRLAAIAAEQLPATLEASDRTLALALISVAEAELEKRTGVGGLQSDTLLKLSEVLDWVSDAAGFYAPPS